MRKKIWIKILAVVLCVITSFGAVASGISVLYMAENGLYDGENLSESDLQKEFLNFQGFAYDNSAHTWLYIDLLTHMNSWQFFYDRDEVIELAEEYIENNFPKNDEYFGISILDESGNTIYSSLSSDVELSGMETTKCEILLCSSLSDYMEEYGYLDSCVEYYVEGPNYGKEVAAVADVTEAAATYGDEEDIEDEASGDTTVAVDEAGEVTEAENATKAENATEAENVTEAEVETESQNVTIAVAEADDYEYYATEDYDIYAVELYGAEGSFIVYKNEYPQGALSQMYYTDTADAVEAVGRNEVAYLVYKGKAYLYKYNSYEDVSDQVTRAAQLIKYEDSTKLVMPGLASQLSDEEREFSFNIYLNSAVIVENYSGAYELFEAIYGIRYGMIGIFVACLLVFLVCFIYLLAACGHRAGEEGADEIKLNLIDRIPSDVFLAVLVGVAILVLDASTYYSSDIILIGAIYIAFLLSFVAVLSIATRLKVGCFIKDALLYRGCGWLGTRLIAVIRSLPLIWKWAIIGAVLLAINVIIFCFCFDYEGLLSLIGIVVDIAIYLGILLFLASYAKIETAAKKMAEGDLNYQLDTNHLYGGLKEQGENMNLIGNNLGLAVEEQMKSERMKTELITNVSHDIKTPLTSIINYVDLLKKEEMPSDTAVQYLEVIDRQSARLKKLIVDLIEASKASSGNVEIEPVPTDVNELLVQTTAEYESRCQEKNLEMVINLLPETAHILVDGRHIWRVLDNILGNAYKYSLENTRIYIDVTRRDGQICLSFKNVSATPLNISADELLERFVRGDSSRNTEGSGLGLSIAKSLTELQGGEFKLEIDGDLFKCEMTFPEIKNEKS